MSYDTGSHQIVSILKLQDENHELRGIIAYIDDKLSEVPNFKYGGHKAVDDVVKAIENFNRGIK